MSSVTARVFRGCRALLAPASTARSSTKTASKSPAKLPQKPQKQTQKPNSSRSNPKAAPRPVARPNGIFKASRVSAPLGQFLGAQEASHVDAVKLLWSYVKTNNLQNPTNKREIVCDEKLKAIFYGKEKVHIFEVGKLLSSHFVKGA